MTPSTDLLFIDTNIFVYALFGDSPQHSSARTIFDRAKDDGAGLCTALQVLAEFYAVVTDPRRVSPARRPSEAAEDVERILEMPGISILPIPSNFAHVWLSLVRRYEVSRQDIFDVQIAALMLANGVTRIATFDARDFARFSEITVILPNP